MYGAQWRKWDTKQSVVVGHNGSYNEFGTIIKDQISNLIKGLKERPLATDHIVNAWNVGDFAAAEELLQKYDFSPTQVINTSVKSIKEYLSTRHGRR